MVNIFVFLISELLFVLRIKETLLFLAIQPIKPKSYYQT